MIDIHCHILPAVDDGVRTMEEATALIAMEASGGTKAFFATSHVMDKRDYDRLGQLESRLGELRAALARESIGVDILAGGEVYPTSAMLDAIDAGQPVTLGSNGRYMLVDLPLMALPHDFDDLLYELHLRGITPILAHPERAVTFQQEPDRLLPYLEKGFACQVNAGSLAGKYGPRAAEVAKYYLDLRWANFLASDAHRPPRKPILGECVRKLRPAVGNEYIDYLTQVCPSCVRDGRDLPPRQLMPPRRPSVFERIFARRRA